MSESLGRRIRASGILDQLAPAATLRQQEAVRQIVDDVGRLSRRAVLPYIAPERFTLGIAGALTAGQVSLRDRVERAGTLVRLAAHAATAPASSCVVRLIDTDANTLATVTIPAGQSSGESAGLAVPPNGGTWLAAVVDTAGGVVYLSIVATERMD